MQLNNFLKGTLIGVLSFSTAFTGVSPVAFETTVNSESALTVTMGSNPYTQLQISIVPDENSPPLLVHPLGEEEGFTQFFRDVITRLEEVESLYYKSNIDFFDGFSVLTDEQRAYSRLSQMGLSTERLETMSEEAIEILANGISAIIVESYFNEISGNDYEDLKLEQISREDFYRKQPEDQIPNIDHLLKDIQIIENNPRSRSFLNEHPFVTTFEGWNQNNVGGGTLHVVTALIHSPIFNVPGRYIAISEFFWTTMPTRRGTDVLALSRGVGYSVLGTGNFESFVSYSRHDFMFTAPSNQVFTTYLGTVTNTSNPTNQLPISNGASIQFNVPSNVIPNSMIQGQIAFGRTISNLRGGITYVGTLNINTNAPGSFIFNNYAMYFHQTGTTLNLSPSVTVTGAGISASIGITPSAQFQRIENNLSTPWTIH